MHPFLRVEDRQPHKTKSLQAGWLLDIDVLQRPLFRKKSKLDLIALISIKIHRFRIGFTGCRDIAGCVRFSAVSQPAPGWPEAFLASCVGFLGRIVLLDNCIICQRNVGFDPPALPAQLSIYSGNKRKRVL
jgi:hypothetical protein